MTKNTEVSPELLAGSLQQAGDLVRAVTSSDLECQEPASAAMHDVFRECHSPESLAVITRLLDRRLKIDDYNYTLVQTFKAVFVIRNGLLSAPAEFVEHYRTKRSSINDLRFVNIKNIGDDERLLRSLHDEAKRTVDLLTSSEELESQRAYFASYQGAPEQSLTGVDTALRDYTGCDDNIDPGGLLNRIHDSISNDHECDIIIRMIERRLNPLDTNYSCNHLLKSLKVLQHCLTGSDKFIGHWINHSSILLNLARSKCYHNSCDPEDDLMPQIHKQVNDILARLDHHHKYITNATVRSSTTPKGVFSLRDGTCTTPPPSMDVGASSPSDWNLKGVPNLTDQLIRSSQYPVAQGTFSDVYKEHLPSGEEVAVKQLRLKWPDGGFEKAKKALRRELGIWHPLEHPYINPLYGVTFTHNEAPGFVSPWYKNSTLTNFLKDNPEKNRLVLFYKIVQAVEYLHEGEHKHGKSIIHGDIKPCNILVKDNDDPALSDYGLSKLMDDFPSSTSGNGTHNYQAPELLDGARRNKGSDVYALACVCYAMFTGHHPYHQTNKLCVWAEVRKGPPPRPNPDTERFPMNDALWKILVSCWKDTSERISATSLLRRLKKVPNGGLLPGYRYSRTRESRAGLRYEN